MSKTVPVEFADRFFWAYDVSFGILILEAIAVAEETPQPDGAGDVLDGLRANAEVGASYTFRLDDEHWSQPQREFVHEIIAVAGRRLRERDIMSRAEADARYATGRFSLRFEEHVDGTVVADLAEAMDRLIHDTLPPVPTEGRHWLFGIEHGPQTT